MEEQIAASSRGKQLKRLWRAAPPRPRGSPLFALFEQLEISELGKCSPSPLPSLTLLPPTPKISGVHVFSTSHDSARRAP